MKIKKIAVLTSGGDAPGMNSALFGVYSACRDNNIKLIGYIGGYDGLIDNNFKEITFDTLDGRLNRGGSVIKSSRSPRFLKKTYFNKAVQNLKDNKVDALIVMGGDGSIRGAMELIQAGIKVIVVPCTIDNDLNFTFTLGFDSATNNIVNAVDNITDSLSAFGYGSVIKIMGRECTDLIDSVSKAIHTDLIIKSKNFDEKELLKKIKATRDSNHLPSIVLVLEDTVDCVEYAERLQEKCKFQWRAHILGYIQRGGTPSAFDRRYGYSVGQLVVNYIMKNETGFAVGMIGDSFKTKSLEDTIKKTTKSLT